MTSSEPLLPPSHNGEQIAAADGGVGAPAPAPGTDRDAEEPDTASEIEPDSDRDAAIDPGTIETPFRTPEPPR